MCFLHCQPLMGDTKFILQQYFLDSKQLSSSLIPLLRCAQIQIKTNCCFIVGPFCFSCFLCIKGFFLFFFCFPIDSSTDLFPLKKQRTSAAFFSSKRIRGADRNADIGHKYKHSASIQFINIPTALGRSTFTELIMMTFKRCSYNDCSGKMTIFQNEKKTGNLSVNNHV